jgi:hypothetical protein
VADKGPPQKPHATGICFDNYDKREMFCVVVLSHNQYTEQYEVEKQSQDTMQIVMDI